MNGWRGLNESLSPAHLRPGDLAAVSNMDIRDGIALSSRLGQTSEHNRTHPANLLGVKRILRYKSLTGVKKRLVMFGNNLRADTNDNGEYDYVCSIAGTPWLLQYYDVVLFGSEKSDMGVYDPINGGVTYPNARGVVSSTNGLTTANVDGDGFLDDSFYTYRYTYDISVGGVFLGETGNLHIVYKGSMYANTATFSFAARADNNNKVEFYRGPDVDVAAIPSYVSSINIYRSPPLTATPASGHQKEERFDLVRAGSINMDDMRAATYGTLLFTDRGMVFGKQIPRLSNGYMPRSKRVAMHKGRLWWSSPHIRENDEADYTYWPDLVACGPSGANGTEPFVFYPEMTWAVGAGEPDEITVFKSVRNQHLGICKEDKTFAVLGADTEIGDGVPDVAIQLVDAQTGCDAPDSCVEVDGGAIMFQSERGVMLWDGAAPRPVAFGNIKSTFNSILPTRKQYSVGAWNAKEREYDLFCTIPDNTTDAGSSYNRHYLRFNATTQTWVSGKLQRGVGATCYVNDADAKGYMLWGIDDNPLPTFASTPWVMRADNGFREAIDDNPNGDEKIDFSVDFGYQDAGAPWLRKAWTEIAVEFESLVPLSVEIWVDSKGPFSPQAGISAPTGENDLTWGTSNWGEANWASSSFGVSRRVLTRSLNTLPKGNSIRVKLSGTNVYDPIHLYSVTVFYTPEES